MRRFPATTQRANSIAGFDLKLFVEIGTRNSSVTKKESRRSLKILKLKDVPAANWVTLAPVCFRASFLRSKPAPQNMGITFIIHYQDKIVFV